MLGPLRDLASAVETVGRDTQADIFAGVALEPASRSVDVWVTDMAAGEGLLRAAQASDPAIDTSLAHLLPAAHSKVELNEDAKQLVSGSGGDALPHELYSVAIKPDGSGLELGVSDPSVAKRKSPHVLTFRKNHGDAIKADVQVTFTKAEQGIMYNRLDDTAPWVGGDAVSDGSNLCTLGVPALRKSNNSPVLLTAGHCFAQNAEIVTGTGSIPKGAHYIGPIEGKTPSCTANGQAHCFDAELMEGANIAAAAEGLNPHPIVSVKYSAMNDYVCHDGYVSFAQKRGDQVCGIKVTNSNYWRNMGNSTYPYWIQGIQGKSSGYGATHGDSGGVVYTYDACGCNKLQARGSISGGPVDKGPEVWWTETLDVFNMWGLKLNPKTTWP